MDKKLFERGVLSRLPGWRAQGGFFFKPHFEHIVTGFVLDPVPEAPALSVFALPLFASPELLHLGYSEVVGGPDELGVMHDTAAFAEQCVTTARRHWSRFERDATADGFLKTYDLVEVRANPRLEFGLALVHGVARNVETARERLTRLLESYRLPQDRAHAELALQHLTERGELDTLAKQWTSETRHRLKLI